MKDQIIENLIFIRRLEEAIAQKYSEQDMRCPAHLSIGQELPPIAVCNGLSNNDLAVGTHRSHAHYLAKGGDPSALVAELYGKETGCAGGVGGSMHLIDESVGFYGSTAIVGNSIPIGVGLALALKMENKSENLCVVFLGDAAMETGSFLESANFAAVNKLPVIFVCENNRYSVYSDLSSRQPEGRSIEDLSKGLGLNYRLFENLDIHECAEETTSAIKFFRCRNEPALFEFPTFRHREHCGPNFDDHLGYRDPEEVSQWLEKDPINNFLHKHADRDELNNIEKK